MWTTDMGVNGIHGCPWKRVGNTHGNERWSWKRKVLSDWGQEQAQKIWATFRQQLLERLVVSSLISVAVIKYPNRKHLWEKRTYLLDNPGYSSSQQGRHFSRSWQQCVAPIRSQQQRGTECRHVHSLACPQRDFSTCIQFKISCLRNVDAHSRLSLHTLI